MATPCTVDDCQKLQVGRGLCRMHYTRLRRHGDIAATKQLGPARKSPSEYPAICQVDDCGRRHRALGYCLKHYSKLRKYRDPKAGVRIERKQFTLCQFDGCGKPYFSKLMCRNHYETCIGGPVRRLRIASSSVPFSVDELNARLAYFGRRCWMCGGPFEAIDHVKPLSKGGPHMLANLRPACRDCNSRKGCTWPLEVKI